MSQVVLRVAVLILVLDGTDLLTSLNHQTPVLGTFVPRSECRMFPGTFVPGIVSSLSDHGKGCWHCSESKSKNVVK